MTNDRSDPLPSPPSGLLLSTEHGEIAVFSHGAHAMSLFESDGRIVDVNDAWLALYGYTREEALSMHVTDVSAEPEATLAALGRTSLAGGERIDGRFHRRKDGHVFPVDLTSGTLRIATRVLVYAVIVDITDRLREAEALARSESRFRALIESIPDAVLVHREGRIVYINPAACTQLGYPDAAALIGRPVLDLVHEDDRPNTIERIRELFENGVPAPLSETRLLRGDGTSIRIEIAAIPTTFDGLPAALAMGRDVSLRREMEAKLVMSDRLAALGRLAASVGHEINNPLAYVLGNVELLRRDVARAAGQIPEPLREELDRHLALVEQGASRVRDIVRDLRTLSRAESDAARPVDMPRLLDVCASMANHELRHRARLVKDYRDGCIVRGNEARLGQVFLNLLVNAAQSIPEGDTAGNEVRLSLYRDGETSVVVEVEDTGAGIAEDASSRLFEPFFTTRSGEGGTGLGLSICHHIVQSYGGTIEASAVRPRGTRFRVTLPTGMLTTPATTPPPTPRGLPRPLRVLVIDDEVQVAHVARKMLAPHAVDVAADGREGLRRLETEAPYDVILCDIRMADRTGLDVYQTIRLTWPQLARRFIFLSAGGLDEATRNAVGETGRPCLDKPFTEDDLRLMLERVVIG